VVTVEFGGLTTVVVDSAGTVRTVSECQKHPGKDESAIKQIQT
jgi:hypothetical protein